MMRFIPDTWLEWLLRPFAMGAPNGWVYTELVAPDFRFAMVVVLALVLGVSVLRRRARAAGTQGGRGVCALGLLMAVAFVPWLATTGNGRYFMPFLILVGPLCIALAMRLPATPAMRTFAVVFALVAQGFALMQNSPWKPFDSWEWVAWKETPYFELDTRPVAADENITYVTLPNLTYSLIAPLFPKSSRWVNLSGFDTLQNPNDYRLYKPVEAMLREGTLRLVQRAQVHAMLPGTLQPDARALTALNAGLARHGLKVPASDACRILLSRSLQQLTTVASEYTEEERKVLISHAGFWVCSLERQPRQQQERPELTPAQLRAQRIFARMEAACPRFFRPGQDQVRVLKGNVLQRVYTDSDSSLLLDVDDSLYIKYERTLNPQRLARGEEVLQPGFTLDCNSFKGRAGLPWERTI